MKRIVKFALLGFLAVMPPSQAFGQTDETKAKINQKELRAERSTYLASFDCDEDQLICGKPSILSPNVLIVGDSHALDAFNSLYSAYPEVNFMLSSLQQCVPFAEAGLEDKCAEANAARWAQIDALNNLVAVVIKIKLDGDRGAGLAQFVQELAGKYPKLVVFGAGHRYTRELPEVYERFNGEKLDEFRDESPYSLDEDIRAAVQSAGGVFIDQKAFLCPNGICADIARDGKTLVMADKHHQTLQTARELGAYIRAEMPDLFVGK